MCCKKSVLMTFGTSTWTEVCQESWTGFTKFTLVNEKLPQGCMLSGRRLTKIQATTRPDYLWPEIWTGMSKAAKKKEKQEWASEKPKVDNARRSRGIYFVGTEDGEHKETIKLARKKLEVPMEAAVPCKLGTRKRLGSCKKLVQEGSQNPTERQSMRVSWKRMNPRESVWNPLFLKFTKITSWRNGSIRWITTIYLVRNCSDAASDENSGCESCS